MWTDFSPRPPPASQTRAPSLADHYLGGDGDGDNDEYDDMQLLFKLENWQPMTCHMCVSKSKMAQWVSDNATYWASHRLSKTHYGGQLANQEKESQPIN